MCWPHHSSPERPQPCLLGRKRSNHPPCPGRFKTAPGSGQAGGVAARPHTSSDQHRVTEHRLLAARTALQEDLVEVAEKPPVMCQVRIRKDGMQPSGLLTINGEAGNMGDLNFLVETASRANLM